MKIECPHCGQRIDLEGNSLSSFSCPTCSSQISLQVTKGTGVPDNEQTQQGIESVTTRPTGEQQKVEKAGEELGTGLLKLIAVILIGIPLGKCGGKMIQNLMAPDWYDETIHAPQNLRESPPRLPTVQTLNFANSVEGVPPTREGIIGTWHRQTLLPSKRQHSLLAPQPEYFKFSSAQKFEHGNIPQPPGGIRNSMTKGDYRLEGKLIHFRIEGSDDWTSQKVWMKNGNLVLEMPSSGSDMPERSPRIFATFRRGRD